ncbi:hypothetical protein OUZ56_007221 [Daphnia magna]|uniref:Gem-associated protein 7 n=1 Tax=Daphnia magna TaxID=35525 RepID=A0ABQ9YXZ2_9CRUS|nr:hypothetical protein OUZ56_007221 [Daphnia magna]
MSSDEEARAWLREHFLRTLTKFNGKDAVFTMHQNIMVTGQYECSSADLKYFHVSDLKTPLGNCKQSLLRSSDVISIDFKSQSNLFPEPILHGFAKDCVQQNQ